MFIKCKLNRLPVSQTSNILPQYISVLPKVLFSDNYKNVVYTEFQIKYIFQYTQIQDLCNGDIIIKLYP